MLGVLRQMIRKWEMEVTGTDGETHIFALEGETIFHAMEPVWKAWKNGQDYYGYFSRAVMNITLNEMLVESEIELIEINKQMWKEIK
jgi:hypothetical protein